MKKFLSLICAAAMICAMLAACGDPSGTSQPTEETTLAPTTTAPTETIPAETAPETGIYGDSIVVGNFSFKIPAGYSASISDDKDIVLSSSDRNCAIGFYAMDVSAYDQQLIETYLPQQHQSFASSDEGVIRKDQEPLEASVGDFDISMDFYYELKWSSVQAAATTYKIVGTFTDSWNVYTIILMIDERAEDKTACTGAFLDMIYDAEYLGAEPRFDFVQ